MTRVLPIDFGGETVELRGWLRLKDVTGTVGLWLREDADGTMLSVNSMQNQSVTGTSDWAEYRVSLPIDEKAQQLLFGVLMNGTGTVWADDLELLVDGKPIASAKAAPVRPQLPADHEFDARSGINVTTLTPLQIENLATLGQVWGFLKYHHPTLTSGQRHWDYELFRVMPEVLAATDRAQADEAMTAWIDKLGPVPDCNACAIPPHGELDLKPDVEWIRNRDRLGTGLSDLLQRVYANRTGKQFFVSLRAAGANPSFDHELG